MASPITRVTRASHVVNKTCPAVHLYLELVKHLCHNHPGTYQVYLHHTGPSNYMLEVVDKKLIDPVCIYICRGLAEPACLLNVLPALGLDEFIKTSFQHWVHTTPQQLEIVYNPETLTQETLTQQEVKC